MVAEFIWKQLVVSKIEVEFRELHVLKARLIGGLMNKARRGELYMRPPLGFIYDARKFPAGSPRVLGPERSCSSV